MHSEKTKLRSFLSTLCLSGVFGVRAKYMKGVGKTLVFILVLLESLFFVLPSSGMYIFGMVILVNGTFTGNAGSFGFNTAFFIFTLIFLLPGYALYSLWWLILQYRNIISFKLIPAYIYGGLLVGVFSTIVLASPFRVSTSTKSIPLTEQLENKLYFGLGPLLVMVTLMVIIYFQSRSNKYSQQEKPTLRSGFPLL